MPPDLMPLVVGQLPTLTLTPLLYLAIVAVVVIAAVFSKRAGRQQAALDVLRLLLPRRDPPKPARRSPPER